jgi:hypothetical protein
VFRGTLMQMNMQERCLHEGQHQRKIHKDAKQKTTPIFILTHKGSIKRVRQLIKARAVVLDAEPLHLIDNHRGDLICPWSGRIQMLPPTAQIHGVAILQNK